MTQEEKQLLLKDLSARLPYSVKIAVNDRVETLQGINVLDNVAEYGSFLSRDIEEVKPYLFPLSNMTGEQKKRNLSNTHPMRCVKKTAEDTRKLTTTTWLVMKTSYTRTTRPLIG